ncbi:MAG: IS66 family insertion sequence element accessory protein TnpA [Gammaproteobacteria bacterium]
MSEAQKPELAARLQGWLDHVRACEASGQTMAEYAKAHGLALKAFYNGRTHLIRRGVIKAKRQGAVFQRVGVVSGVSSALDCRVHFPNGLMVEFGVDELRLGRVLQLAKGL